MSATPYDTVSMATASENTTSHIVTSSIPSIVLPSRRVSTTHASLPLNVHPDLAEQRHAFSCLVCFEQFTGPIELDCHHTFCNSCLRVYGVVFPDRGNGGDCTRRTWCPICQQPTGTQSTSDGDVSKTTSVTMTPKALAENRSSLIRKVFEQTLKCDCCIATLMAGVLLQTGVAAALVSPLAGPAVMIDASSATDAHTSFGVPLLKNGFANGDFANSAAADGSSKLSGDAGIHGRGRRTTPCIPLAEDADFHCSKCELNLCKSCRARHDAQPLFRGHAVVNVTNREAVQLYCQIHTTVGTGRRRTCLFYCADCDRLECVVCLLHDDPQHRAIKLRDALAERRDALKTLLNTLGPRLDRFEAHVIQLKKMYSERRQNRVSAISTPNILPSVEANAESDSAQSRPFISSISSQFRRYHFRDGSGRRKSGNDTSSSYGTRQAHCKSEAGPDDEDWGSAGTMDSDPATAMTTDCTDDIESRRDSVHSEEYGSVPGGQDAEEETIRSPISFPAMADYLGRLRKLFDKSTKVLEIYDSKKLLAIYNDLSSRLTTVVDVELGLLQKVIDDRTMTETTYRRLTTGNDSPVNGEACRAGSLAIPQSKRGSIGSNGSSPDSTSAFRSHPLQSWSGDSNNNNINTTRKPLSRSSTSELLATMTTQPAASGVSCGNGTVGADGVDAAGGFRPRTSSFHVPMSLLVRPKLIWKIEKQRTDIGEMFNPSDVAFLPDETSLVVAEYDSINDRNNRLQLFDCRTGRRTGDLGQGQMQPLGVAATRDGQHLAVTDCRGKRVRLLSLPTGQTVVDIGKGQFGWPYGVAVTSHGQIVVTDAFNDTVSIFSPDGKKLKTIGGPGSSTGATFRNPYHVTVDDRDIVLVSDFGNNAVKAFDLTGRLVYTACEGSHRGTSEYFGPGGLLTAASASSAAAGGGVGKNQTSAASKRRRLKGPRGIAVEYRQRHVIVADDRSRVCLLSPSGQYVRNLLSEDDSVKYPEAIDCSRSGLLAVTEWNQNNAFAIKLFNLYE